MYLAFNVSHLKQDMTIGIIGLGYVGLPTAIGFHDAGFNVWGVDVSQRTVDMVLKGENPTGDPDVDDIVPAPGTERWHITNSAAEAVPHCDVVLVTVPTPITHDLKPDLSYVAAAGRDVFEVNSKGLKHHCCPRINGVSRRYCANLDAHHQRVGT